MKITRVIISKRSTPINTRLIPLINRTCLTCVKWWHHSKVVNSPFSCPFSSQKLKKKNSFRVKNFPNLKFNSSNLWSNAQKRTKSCDQRRFAADVNYRWRVCITLYRKDPFKIDRLWSRGESTCSWWWYNRRARFWLSLRPSLAISVTGTASNNPASTDANES